MRSPRKIGGMVFALAVATSSAAFSAITPRAVSCDGCDEQQRLSAITSVATIPGASQVYVLDVQRRELKLVDVWVDVEPGLFNVTTDEVPVPAEASRLFAELLDLEPMSKTFEPIEVPAGCVSEGSSFAANHASDQACRSFTYNQVRGSYQNSLQAWARGPLAISLVTGFTRNHDGAPRVVWILVRAPDGSTVELEATIRMDIDGDVIVTDLKTVRATANNIDLPLQASDLRGQSYTAFNASVYSDFRRLFSNWSVDSRRQCSTRQRIVCPVDPSEPCTSYITCGN